MTTTTPFAAVANKVLRTYAITPGTVQGRKLADPCEVVLRYTEGEANILDRNSEKAAAEAVKVAVRRGLLPAGTPVTSVEWLRESLKRDERS